MKVLKLPESDVGQLEEVLSEARILSKMGHPNIVRVFDANTFELEGATYAFFTMEYVAGGSLDRIWRSYADDFMPVEESISIVSQVCSGIAVGHSEQPPIVHRDIKPQNILIGYDGSGMRVRISDFGLAKHANPLTMLLSARGTLAFKPPEALVNQDSPAADVWALGATLYLLLTDTLPFPGLHDRSIEEAKGLVGELRPASQYNYRVDQRLEAILEKCLAINPEDRIQSASGMLKELHKWEDTPRKTSGAAAPNVMETSKELVASYSFGGEDPSILVEQAQGLSKSPARLQEAADLLEEAINRAPQIRKQYEATLRLWRRGICM